MTNEPTNFLPLSGFGGFDYLTAGTQPSEKGVAPARRNTCRLWDQQGDPKWLGRGEIIVYDFSQQGINHPDGDFSQNSNGYATGNLVTYRANELTRAPLTVSLSDSGISGNYAGFHTCAAFSTVFMGIGSAANKSLFKETSATDSTPVAITYTPTNEICSLSRTLASGAERLAVGRVGSAVQFLSDASGTVSATGDASTNSCWGIIMSGVNADANKAGTPQLLLYCGTTIGYISSDVAMTTAVTTSHTGVPAGGFAIGAIKAGGRAQMAYWGIPKVSNTSGAMKFGAEAFCDIYASPMDGSKDWLPVDLKYLPNGVLYAIPFRDGILAHDGEHVVYWDGDDEYDLVLFKKRISFGNATITINHDEVRRIRALIVNGPECGVIWQYYKSDASGAGRAFCEMYNFETGSWHAHSSSSAMSTTSAALETVLVNGSAISATGLRFWWFNNATTEKIIGHFIPRAGESLLWQHNLGSGATTTQVPFYGDTAVGILGCRWRLDEAPPGTIPGTKTIARAPKVIYEAEFNGNLDYGGTGQAFQIQVYGYGMDGTTFHTAYDQTFTQGRPASDYVRKSPPTAWTNIQDVQLNITSLPPSSVQKTAQFLPFTVRFLYSKDGRQITMEEIQKGRKEAWVP